METNSPHAQPPASLPPRGAGAPLGQPGGGALRSPESRPRIAACAVTLTAGGDLHLIPAGEFRGRDGRPKDVAAWRLDASSAARLIGRAANRPTRIVVDYEHQTLHAAKNGQPAPAAGWIEGARLEWRDGEGLFATGIDWTGRAAAMIAANEYRYLSPVFAYAADGTVLDLLMVGLTNFPNLDGLDEVALAVAANSFLPANPSEDSPVNEEILEQLRWLLNLPVGSSAGEIAAHLEKLVAQIKGANPEAAANGVDLPALLAGQQTRIAALTAQVAAGPDLAQYVPLAHVQQLQAQVAALTAQLNQGEAEQLIAAASADGRLPPALAGWARDLATQNIAALKSYLASAVPVVPLGTTQSGGVAACGAAPASPEVSVAMQIGGWDASVFSSASKEY